MKKNAALASALAGLLGLFALSVGRAQLISLQPMGPEVRVQVRMEADGEASVSVWGGESSIELAPILPQVLNCQSGVKLDPDRPNTIRCSQALRRDGLALEGVVDLAPIARKLAASEVIELGLDTPRLGFESSSLPMEKETGRMRINQMARFQARSAPPPIQVRFGYRPNQLTGQLPGVYLPLVALAFGLTLLAAILSRSGLAGLSRSGLLLGTILWMGAAAQLQAAALVHLLLYGSRLANFAALFVQFWPPLFCVAAGVALGSRKTASGKTGNRFGEVFWGFAVIPLILTSAVGALPSMMAQNWLAAIPWLVAAPAFALLRRAWIRASARASVHQLTEGELRDRVSALVAKARRPPIKIFISFLTRSQASTAFTLPGKSIYLTAPLVRSLSKREVDAVVAHELSHFNHSSRGQWTALALAMVLFGTSLSGVLLSLPGGLIGSMLLPLIVLFAALRGARRREFAADLSAAALTGDPRAMISSLARISRNNKISLEMNRAAEWLSTHPSTRKRIQALAAAARLSASEVETLCNSDDPGDSYELPAEEAVRTIFTPAWQNINAGIYGWTVLLGCGAAGFSVAWLLYRSAGAGAVQLLVGIVLGCLLTKGLAATVMASNYARVRRKLEAKLGVSGQLVGLAVDSEPRMYQGRRFSDAGLLWFSGGRLCYQSERTIIALNPADVVEVAMVAASPSNWIRLVPRVRFRRPDSGGVEAFILHPVNWLATQQRLFKSILRWKATETAADATSIAGLQRIEGKPFPRIRIASLGFALAISVGAALAAAIPSVLALHLQWWFLWYALAIAACAQIFMYLPSMLYRPPLSAEPTPGQAESKPL